MGMVAFLTDTDTFFSVSPLLPRESSCPGKEGQAPLKALLLTFIPFTTIADLGECPGLSLLQESGKHLLIFAHVNLLRWTSFYLPGSFPT